MLIIAFPYNLPTYLPDEIFFVDHLNGFNDDGTNAVFDQVNKYCIKHSKKITIYTHTILPVDILSKIYSNLIFKYTINNITESLFESFTEYTVHPRLNHKNFLCSFNGSAHVSRKLLVSILKKFQWFNPAYCSKNFSYPVDVLDGHISDYVGDSNNFYRKFFIGDCSEEFFQTVNSFGFVQYDHASNIYNLEHKVTESFLHVVAETMATSYYPFVTEKFLYSIVTRGLFLAYAQPRWHAYLEKYYGFRSYTRLFDYRFDTIENPIERLVELMSMISKFSMLTPSDWQGLYEIETDTIEYNYNHYFSGNYLKCLKTFNNA